ncbi:RagB/SusD family nutrient uptake outer membrane protein [Niabella pedocola]|uniref:RagB/SusD family nutrient uptake outer membrane protein n=1 Tax=Niabella pedocola TaxID=1752077 RepID=A0ABS8PNB7_9BACT|nr:RagB/SusD family nutrient uptake outer membrane protein [Niabella pedocola]MCD2422610.1 RagB/SusD family nutrient uptake outer membrane protein [Niabella pedocola]
MKFCSIKNKERLYWAAGIVVSIVLTSCKKYLDIVPDNIATIDNAFATRTQAEKYLGTCYSYLLKDADPNLNPALTGGDEMIPLQSRWSQLGQMFNIARGNQNFVTPVGQEYWVSYYKAIRDCNIFLENARKVPGVPPSMKTYWIAEVKFLKAWYHFCLLRMYGPVPLIKQNLAVDAPSEAVKAARNTADECFSYINELLDEAKDSLPDAITNQDQLGRISKPVAYAVKAKIMVTAASPLYNGNTDAATLKNNDGTLLFNQTADPAKWAAAVTACKEAVDICAELGYTLHTVPAVYKNVTLTNTMRTQLGIRTALTERWNDEIIWANTQSWANNIQFATPPKWDPAFPDNIVMLNALEAPIKIAEQFYTKNGVPIEEDKTYSYDQRYALRTAIAADGLMIRQGYTTATLNFDREQRFYASLGFDGGIWYGQGRFDDSKPLDLYYISSKRGQVNGLSNPAYGPVTGYAIKKVVHFENTMDHTTRYSYVNYAWPLMRLADLYLLYAEALNEANGPGAQVYQYVNLVRERAGLPAIETAWTNFSKNPAKYTTKDGLRSIIHKERNLELMFEGHRFWDLRRWKEGIQEYNAPLRGWDIYQSVAIAYYNPVTLYNQRFSLKDYFWPISEDELTRNTNLKQNIGW